MQMKKMDFWTQCGEERAGQTESGTDKQASLLCINILIEWALIEMSTTARLLQLAQASQSLLKCLLEGHSTSFVLQ